MQENKYIGDQKFQNLLDHYHCPAPLDLIKMRFAGAICSPNLELRPTDVISSFWPDGQAPRLQTKEEADLFFKYFMGLWDEVFAAVRANNVRLPELKINENNAPEACEKRFAEVEHGYVEGFWGGCQDLQLPAYLAEVIDSLSDLAGVYTTLAKKLDKGGEVDEIVKTIRHSDRTAEKAISFIIENSVLPRIDNLRRTVQ